MQSQPTNFPSGEHRATLPGAFVGIIAMGEAKHCTVALAERYVPSAFFSVATQHQLVPSEKPSTGLAQFFGEGFWLEEQLGTTCRVLYPPRGVVVTAAPHMLLTRGSGTGQPGDRESDRGARTSCRGPSASDPGARTSGRGDRASGPAPASPPVTRSPSAGSQARVVSEARARRKKYFFT